MAASFSICGVARVWISESIRFIVIASHQRKDRREGGRPISQSYSRGSCLRNVSGQDHPAKIPNTLALVRTGTAFGLNFSSKRIFQTRHTLLDLDGMVRSKEELSFGNTGVKAAPLSDRWTESVIHTHARTLSGGEVI